MAIGKRIGRIAFVFALVAVAVVGSLALFTPPAQAKGPCLCPQIYAPVMCDNGKIYPNQCEANCHRAKNCVPVGII